MALGKAQKTVLCRLAHRSIPARGAVARTLSTLRRKGYAKRGRSKGSVVITKKGKGAVRNVCGRY